MAVIHGFLIGMYSGVFLFVHLVFWLMGFLIRGRIRKTVTKRGWLIILLLLAAGCDAAYFMLTGWDRLTASIVSCLVMDVLLGHGVCVLVELFKQALQE